MVHKTVFTLLACLLVSMATQMDAQQAWTKPKGAYFAQIGGSYLQANKLLNGLEESIPLNRDVTDITIQAYGEYGITNKFMVSGQLPFKILQAANTTNAANVDDGKLYALSNIQLAATVLLYNKNGYVISGKTDFSLPTASFQSGTGLRSGFDALTVSPSIMAGLGHRKFFTSAEAGYAIRTNGYSNRVFGAWQIGKFLGKNKKILPILSLNFMKSLEGDGYNDGTSTTTGLYLNAQSYLSPGLKIGYKASPKIMLWLSAGGGIGGVTKNIAASPGLSFAVSYQK